MGKALLLLAFLSLGVMIVGLRWMPESSLFLLASGVKEYQVIRIVLESAIFLQLVTKPPRHILFRIITGALALSTIVWVCMATYNDQLLPLDTLSILGASIAILITSIERKAVSTEQNQALQT